MYEVSVHISRSKFSNSELFSREANKIQLEISKKTGNTFLNLLVKLASVEVNERQAAP